MINGALIKLITAAITTLGFNEPINSAEFMEKVREVENPIIYVKVNNSTKSLNTESYEKYPIGVRYSQMEDAYILSVRFSDDDKYITIGTYPTWEDCNRAYAAVEKQYERELKPNESVLDLARANENLIDELLNDADEDTIIAPETRETLLAKRNNGDPIDIILSSKSTIDNSICATGRLIYCQDLGKCGPYIDTKAIGEHGKGTSIGILIFNEYSDSEESVPEITTITLNSNT